MLNEITSFESGDNDLPHTVTKNTDDLHLLNKEMRSQNRKILKTERKLMEKVSFKRYTPSDWRMNNILLLLLLFMNLLSTIIGVSISFLAL